MKRMLITGGAGFIGTNTALYFAKKGYAITIFDNLSRKGTRENLTYLQKHIPHILFVNGDIRDEKAVMTVVSGQDVIFHFAAQVAVTTSVLNPKEDFETNAGMITKTDKRTVTLQALELKPNLLMWDIGAGSGSVSIDAYKVFKIRSILFEKNEQQCTFIKNSLKNHKVAAAQLLEGNALENYGELPKPDRIFIGGGGEEVLKKITELYEELNPDGILVANIIGLENLTQAIQTIRTSGIKPVMRTIDITNYKKISENIDLSIPEPERTLFQIILKK